ncbi:DUF2690 domain-containing protein [Nonomuraea sp. NPDC049784]|uniref:DUF2690 domain-containing protein n=1 Tax=Nonomuraea sp. NPDC049784 TaxID=3154361 RepID=UPI0033E462E5
MKLRVAATAVGALAAALLAVAPANAQAKPHPYDHQDPAKSGCWNSAKVVRTADIKSRVEKVGTIKLWWSFKCKTNWVEIRSSSSATGTISVYAADKRYDQFRFKAGNKGRHWGNMVEANNMCAYGTVSLQWNGGRGGQNASGSTTRACD